MALPAGLSAMGSFQGKKGDTGTFDEVTVDVLAAGATPTATIGGTAEHRTVAFGLPVAPVDADDMHEIAVESVNAVVSSEDLVRRSDDVVLVAFDPVQPDDATPVVVGDAGQTLWDFDASGGLGPVGVSRVRAVSDLVVLEPGPVGRVDQVGVQDFTAADPVTGAPTVRASDLIASVLPSVGRVVEAYRVHDPVIVTPRTPAVRRLFARRDQVAFYGESHVRRLAAAVAVDPTVVAHGVTVHNRAYGGINTYEAGVRMGCLSPVLVTVPDLPASGSVTATAEGAIATNQGVPLGLEIWGTLVATTATGIVQVKATLKRAADGGTGLSWTVRNLTAAPVSGIVSAYFVSDDLDTYDGSLVIGSGINAVITRPGVGTLGEAVGQIVAATSEMIDAWRARHGARVLLIGSMVRVDEIGEYSPAALQTNVVGAGGWVVREAERELARIWPHYFYPLRRYIQDRLIVDAGITPTAADLAQIASDALPPSIADPDGQHITESSPQMTALAAHLTAVLAQRGLIA